MNKLAAGNDVGEIVSFDYNSSGQGSCMVRWARKSDEVKDTFSSETTCVIMYLRCWCAAGLCIIFEWCAVETQKERPWSKSFRPSRCR